ncbi:MAG: glucosidase [Bryobacterales bacterium]|nr:glucosidase [Bryobacterales bacterium]
MQFPGNDGESKRLRSNAERAEYWTRWGPYLSERQWGTVREDYSINGDAWRYFPHDQARSRAYRWGEDGLLGISDNHCRLCFGIALWNERDPILKERLYGVTGSEGNHAEDVKEYYYYLDSTPTHSYMKGLYKYPQSAYPYQRLLDENRARGKQELEYELEDSGAFHENRYFDVFVEYAKAAPEDLLIRVTVANRGEAPAPIQVLPQVWFRNTWAWGDSYEADWGTPSMERLTARSVLCQHASLGEYVFSVEDSAALAEAPLLFTENETNTARLFNTPNGTPFVKDGFHRYVVEGAQQAVNPELRGTKAAVHSRFEVPGGGSVTLKLRLRRRALELGESFGSGFDRTFKERVREADEFYATHTEPGLSPEERNIVRQSYAGLQWTKQFYHYDLGKWVRGDAAQPEPPPGRGLIRNGEWEHLFNRDVISMPDKWEYPWYAVWDSAFHMVAFAETDPQFAKDQLLLFLREWYMHPNGQIPAYEWNFSDVNPPVHAWAAWRVFQIDGKHGNRDYAFLERVFQKLMLNFTWWVNRKDPSGNNIFTGGFLGLDNIGVFDRSKPIPGANELAQADATAWMAFFCSSMLSIALELAAQNPVYEDVASKFFEHFIGIADAMNRIGGRGLWDENDGFYYDELILQNGSMPMKIRSLVGLIPMIGMVVMRDSTLERLPNFRRRMQWFLEHRSELARDICMVRECPHEGNLHLLAMPTETRLRRLLQYMLDEDEFLSPYGIRSLSKHHEKHPFTIYLNGSAHTVSYEPAESQTYLFGGNSNWRGPIWFPINYLLIETLEQYAYFYGNKLKVECPTGSGNSMTLQQVAAHLTDRLCRIFEADERGRAPWHGSSIRPLVDEHWREPVLFYEYFHGDTGRGLGASHQTGWTALIARLLEDKARRRRLAGKTGKG